ncbi:MAG: beta-galactosidase [Lentisphaeria bacterium]|nr:beta-galactosidase [Lentisphaeria bacterium]
MKKIFVAVTLGCSLLAAALPPKEHHFEVLQRNGVPLIYKDGKAMHSRMFFANSSNMLIFFKNGKPELISSQIKHAKSQGIDMVSLAAWMIWPGSAEEKTQKKQLDIVMEHAIQANPDILIIPRLLFRPPASWYKKYPDAKTLFTDGSYGTLPNYEHPQFRPDLRKAIEATISHLEEKYGKHIAGYHLAGGMWSEWFYEVDTNRDPWPCWDKHTARSFRKWLKERYKTDEALQKAWKNPAVTLDSAAQPALAVMRDPNRGIHAPAEGLQPIDFGRFLSERTAAHLSEIAAETRQFVGKGRLLLAFYGYTFAWHDFKHGPATSGHYAQEAVLNSPDIDILCSPFGYHDRRLGGTVPAQAAAETIMKRGKIYLSEEDLPTHLTDATNDFPALRNNQLWKPRSAEETRKLLRRNLGIVYAKNYAIWWMDLHGTGWYNDPELWKEMEFFKKIEAKSLANPVPYEPEIGMIGDNNSMLHLFGAGSYSRLVTEGMIHMGSRIGHIGAPFGQYLQDDLLAGLFPKVKLAVFCNSFVLNKSQREAMRRYAGNHGCIWVYAPGFIDGDTGEFSVEKITEVTGFKVKPLKGKTFGMVAEPASAEFMKPYVLPVKYGMREDFDKQYKDNFYFSPVPEKDDIIIARYTSGEPAVVLRPNGKTPQLFSGSPVLPIALMRKMADLSGVHSYVSCGNVVNANENFIAVTSDRDGHITITPRKAGRYRDIVSGKIIGNGKSFNVPVKKGDTLILEEVK